MAKAITINLKFVCHYWVICGYNGGMITDLEQAIGARLDHVKNQIATAAQSVGRNDQDVTLVAVTKTWPAEVVAAAYNSGIRHVGENRPEELADKKRALEEILPEVSDLNWHQIGTVQSRKTKFVVEHADYLHALDRLKIARRLSKQLVEKEHTLPVLIEVNISGEESKSGFMANKWEESATQQETLRNVIKSLTQLPGLKLQGLMTMAPWDVPEDVIRRVFQRTRLLAAWLQDEFPAEDLSQLSMGMSDDYPIAIEEGATIVRVGRAIFGRRNPV